MLSDIQKFAMDSLLIEEEGRRIEPEAVEGDFQAQLKRDMKAHNVELDTWGAYHYNVYVQLFASDMGWLQEGFTGLEMPHDDQ